jgi:hypothetical protein
MKQWDAAALQTKRDIAAEDGFSLSELAGLASDFASQTAGFGVAAGLQDMFEFFKNIPTAQSVSTDQRTIIEGDVNVPMTTNQQISSDLIMNLLNRIKLQAGTI